VTDTPTPPPSVSIGGTISVGEDNTISDNPAVSTFSHTVDASTKTLVVAVEVVDDKDVACVTFNGIGLSQFDDYYPNLLGARRVVIYVYENPPITTANVIVTMATGVNGRHGAVAINVLGNQDHSAWNVDHSTASGVGAVTSGSVSGDFFLNFVVMGGSSGGLTVNAGQTLDDGRDAQDADFTAAASAGSASHKAGPGPTTLGWTYNSTGAIRNWGQTTLIIPVFSPSVLRVRGPAGVSEAPTPTPTGTPSPTPSHTPAAAVDALRATPSPTPTTTAGATPQTKSPTPPPATFPAGSLPNAGGPPSQQSMHLALLALAMVFMACGVLGWKLSRHTPTPAEGKGQTPGLTPASPPTPTALGIGSLPTTGGPPGQQSMQPTLLTLVIFFMAGVGLGWKLSRARP
jgi:hypothetical protein